MNEGLGVERVLSTVQVLAPRAHLLGLPVALCLAAGLWASDPQARMAAAVSGATFLALFLLIRGLAAVSAWRLRDQAAALSRIGEEDPAPCLSTDATGRIGWRNQAARERFGNDATLLAAFGSHFANPAAVLYRLQTRALNIGSAREDLSTRRGVTRLSAHRLGSGAFLWRLEEFVDRSASGRGAEALSLPMLVANKAGVVLFSNDAMRRLVGSRPKRLDRLFGTQTPGSGEEVEITGATGPVRAILAEIEGPGERREIYLLPVTDGRDSDQLLADFEHVPVALLKFRPEGGLRVANRAARELLGITGDDPAVRFVDLFEGLGRSVLDWLADVAAERLPGGAEVLRLRPASEDVFLQVNLRRIVEQGRVGVLAVLQDATALKTLEAQFVQSQKMQAIGQLAGGIAHDFNNLLTAISGHCDLLLLRHTPSDPDYADLVQVHQNANRAAALVGQLLAFSRKQTLKPERLDLRDVLSDLVHLLNRLLGERVTLRLAHSPDLGPIRADRRQLEQVLVNLAVNARDAMPDGGTIRIETEMLSLAADMRRDNALIPSGDYAVIRVEDTGVGIPPDRLQKIFEPFFTTKRPGEGTGLGLSTAYGIIKQSGGFIFVDSAPDAGSTFHVYLPINDSVEESVPVVPPPAPGPRGAMRQGQGVVLLVEDEAPVRAFASRALRMRGYTVVEAENAEQALRALEDPALDIDVFVTDVVMPGMDGPTWVREALRTRPGTRVVFVSGYAEEAVAEDGTKIPNSVFLPKPFSLNDLATTVQGQLQVH